MMTLWIMSVAIAIGLPIIALAFTKPAWITKGIMANMLLLVMLLTAAGLLPIQKVPDTTHDGLKRIASANPHGLVARALESGRPTLWEYERLRKRMEREDHERHDHGGAYAGKER